MIQAIVVPLKPQFRRAALRLVESQVREETPLATFMVRPADAARAAEPADDYDPLPPAPAMALVA